MNNSMKRWLLVFAVALVAVSLACSGTGGSSLPVGESQSNNEGNVSEGDVSEGDVSEGDVSEGDITVEAQEFSFSLSTSEAQTGEITFLVENKGTMPHDFAIRGNGVDETTPQIDPGESATLTVALEPGTYTYICTIPGHEQLGMRGTFTVTSS